GGAGVLRLRGETAQLKWFVGDERLHRRETGVGQPQLARGLFPRGAETVVSDQSQTVTLDQVEPDGVEGALVDQRAHHLGGSGTGVGRLGESLAPGGEPLGQQQVAAVVVATLLLSGGELGDPAAEAVTGAAHRDHEPRGPGVVAEFLAQACDADTQRVEAIVRTGPTPYPGDQPTARHDLAVGLHQTDQQAEFGAGEGERFRVEGGLALPQVDPQWTGDQVTGAGVGSLGGSTHQSQHAGTEFLLADVDRQDDVGTGGEQSDTLGTGDLAHDSDRSAGGAPGPFDGDDVRGQIGGEQYEDGGRTVHPQRPGELLTVGEVQETPAETLRHVRHRRASAQLRGQVYDGEPL